MEILPLAMLIGFLPPIFWLWFFLNEDKVQPEPKKFIIIIFLLGALSIIPSAFFEHLLELSIKEPKIYLLFGWASIEELMKLLVVIIGKKFIKIPIDEPIDWMIYMITAALGFAALENALFILTPLKNGLFLDGLLIGNLRFIGASLLHVLASAIHGAALGLSYFRNNYIKRKYMIIGITTAILVHFIFNLVLFANNNTFNVIPIISLFTSIWIGIIGIILIFEKVKKIHF